MIGFNIIEGDAIAPHALRSAWTAATALPLGPASLPFAFREGFAYIHPASGPTGVVFCASWGYEALCAHRSGVEFAAMLADAGYPTLRFDYPGAGNSALDLEGRKLDEWIQAVVAATDLLRTTCGVKDVVLAGFGLGCLTAAEAVAQGLAVKGVILFVPPRSGRRYIRETQALAAMIAADDDGSELVRPGDIAIAGFVMPAAFAEETRKLDLDRLQLPPGAFCIFADKPGIETGDQIARLAANGADVRDCPLQGYAEIMVGPTMAATPVGAFQRVIGFLREFAPVRQAYGATAELPAQDAIIAGDGFVETAARFGEGERLFGVLCRPASGAQGSDARKPPVVIMISVGRNAHIGWRRMNVENARLLARQGVASLRFDLSGIGDSAPRPGEPAQTIYTDWPPLDVSEAIDYLAAQGFGPVVLFGVCSGAYVGLQTAINDGRVAGLLAANIYRLVWDSSESLEEALRYGNRRIAPAVSRMLTRERMKKILAGKAELMPAAAHLAKRIHRRLGVIAMRRLGGMGPRGALYAECMRRFDILRARNVATTLCYSDDDDGLAEVGDYFGRSWKGLDAYPNVRVVGMARCDHNLTPVQASVTVMNEVLEVVKSVQDRR
ncbi:MAG: alpha/beta fold hydrolase [Rhodoblastus sp.]